MSTVVNDLQQRGVKAPSILTFPILPLPSFVVGTYLYMGPSQDLGMLNRTQQPGGETQLNGLYMGGFALASHRYSNRDSQRRSRLFLTSQAHKLTVDGRIASRPLSPFAGSGAR